jgi:RNA chaperone Hfq
LSSIGNTPAKAPAGAPDAHGAKRGRGWIMTAINVQESFLNVALAGGKHITVQLLNGVQVSGNVRSFDKYSIVLETKTQEQLIFKHSVSALLVCCKNKHCTETCQSGLGVRKAD